jgi:hypothetical protein
MNKTALILALVLLVTGCGPKVKNMPVVYFTPNWEMGEVKDCAEVSADAESFKGDLLCSPGEYDTSLLTLRPGLRDMVTNPKTFAVTFKGSGHTSIYAKSRGWKCRRTTDGISCE